MPFLPVITGAGLVTPLGRDLASTWDGLIEGRHANDHARVDVPGTAPSRVARLGVEAARQAVAGAAWGGDVLADPATALVVGTSKGPVEAWVGPTQAPHVSYGLAQLTADVARSVGHGFGPRLALSAACASGLHALARAVMMIRTGECRRALVVAAEASVHPLFLASFARLGVLPPAGHGCRPFDESRAGFLMSDAAAAVCVEGVEEGGGAGSGGDAWFSTPGAPHPDRTGSDGPAWDVVHRGVPVPHGPNPDAQHLAWGTPLPARAARIAVDAIAIAGDAAHLTGGDLQALALRRCLRTALAPGPVDLVHAHGTGTSVNDPIELDAILRELPVGAGPVLYSHKGALGHSLGAAGLVAVVLNVQSHARGLIPPNVRTTRPLPHGPLRLSPAAVERPVRRSVALAAGFGGAVAAVGLRTV